MEKTSHWAALYFVALMTFGNYVLFNLLVAILVEGFSSEVNIYFFNSSKYLKKTNFHLHFLRETKDANANNVNWLKNFVKKMKQ